MPNNAIVVITAGHCDTSVDHFWYHHHSQGGSTYVGLSMMNGLLNNKDLDALRMTGSGSHVQSPYNRVYNTDSSKSYALTAVIAPYQIYVGMPIRRVGYNTTANGEVRSTKSFYTFAWEGRLWFAWGYNSTATSVTGDSGGPVWALTSSPSGVPALAGFNSTVEGWFAGTGDVELVLGLWHFCTTDAC